MDEIGELPLSIQPKLLLALQQGEIQRVGSEKMLEADVRGIAATNRDLEEEVKGGKFRSDLFHRLCVYPLRVPPLRDRTADIPLLAGYFCDVTRRRLGLGPVRLDPRTVDSLKLYGWPGNVRELENVLSRVILRAAARIPRGNPIIVTTTHLGPDLSSEVDNHDATLTQPVTPLSNNQTLRQATQDFQRSLIEQALAEHKGNWSAAAGALGMHRSNFHHLASRLGLK